MKFPKIEAIFLLILAIFFLFLGFGKIVETAITAIGALLAGIAVRNFLPKERIKMIEPHIKTVTYGLFGPIFFLWVGVDTDIDYLIKYPLLIFLVVAVAKGTKILASYLVSKKELGTKPSLIMGIALGVRFSTSIVIIKLLFESGVMESGLYSVLIGSTVAFKFIIPFLLSYLITKWKITNDYKGNKL
jgi:Ca2+-transporting ATPase